MNEKLVKEIDTGHSKTDRFLILPNGEKVQVLREFKNKYAVCKMNENKYTTKNWWLVDKS